MEPHILVLDEPTAGLDWQGIQKIESVVHRYHEMGRTVIFVSHDMDLVARLAHRILVLKQGELIFDGSKADLFSRNALLQKAGLRLPYIVQAVNKLKETEKTLRPELFSIQEVQSELERLYRG